MEIHYFKKLDSTHKFLLKKIENSEFLGSVMIVSENQSAGVGTGENSWISLNGNLFLSFCIDEKDLPEDLPKQSISIYFAYILKEVLDKFGSKVWLKWPNDFYIEDKKVGGVLSTIKRGKVVCSVGLNTIKAPKFFSILDIKIANKQIIQKFILNIKFKKTWKVIFKNYQVEFEKSKRFSTRVGKVKQSLEDAVLNQDGSIKIDNKEVYSTRWVK